MANSFSRYHYVCSNKLHFNFCLNTFLNTNCCWVIRSINRNYEFSKITIFTTSQWLFGKHDYRIIQGYMAGECVCSYANHRCTPKYIAHMCWFSRFTNWKYIYVQLCSNPSNIARLLKSYQDCAAGALNVICVPLDRIIWVYSCLSISRLVLIFSWGLRMTF